MNTLETKRDWTIAKGQLQQKRVAVAKPVRLRPESTPLQSSTRKKTRRRYTCLICGRKYLSLIELRAHKKKFQGPHLVPKIRVAKSALRAKKLPSGRRRGYRGHRATTRSS